MSIAANVLLALYIFCMFLALILQVYYLFLGGIFIVVVLFLRHKIRYFVEKFTTNKFLSYIILVVILEIVVESLFWFGGLRFFKGITLLDVNLINIPFWFTWGIILYPLGKKLQLTPIEILIVVGLTGILIEMPKALGAFNPLTFILATFINGTNYSFVLAFPFYLTEREIKYDRKIHKWILTIIILYIFVLLYWNTVVVWFHDMFYPRTSMLPTFTWPMKELEW